MSVDESTVIFGPMLHVGWANASSTVTCDRSSSVRPRNGPPLAVRTMRDTSTPGRTVDRRHWCTAQCSLSTGTISAPGVTRSGRTTGPAAMRDSLLANARRRPAPRVRIVIGSPAKPTTAFTTTSHANEGSPNTSESDSTTSVPGRAAATSDSRVGSPTATTCGENSRACWMSASTDDDTLRATTS